MNTFILNVPLKALCFILFTLSSINAFAASQVSGISFGSTANPPQPFLINFELAGSGDTVNFYLVSPSGSVLNLGSTFYSSVGHKTANLTIPYGCYTPASGWKIRAFANSQSPSDPVSLSGGTFTIIQPPPDMDFYPINTSSGDKLIVSRTAGATSDSANLNSSETIYCRAFPYNSGCATASGFKLRVILDVTTNDFTLAAWGSGGGSDVNLDLGTLSPGPHTLRFQFVGGNTPSANTVQTTFLVASAIDLAPTNLAGWSSPLVISRTPGSTIEATNLNAGDGLNLAFAIGNIGKTASGPLKAQILVDTIVFATYTNSTGLQPLGVPWTRTNISLGMLPNGTHQIQLVVDPLGEIQEATKTNNSVIKTIAISTVPPQTVTLELSRLSQMSSLKLQPVVPGITYQVEGGTNLIDWITITNIETADGITEPFRTITLPSSNDEYYYRTKMIYK